MFFKDIDEHMKNKFMEKNVFIKLESLPTNKEMKLLSEKRVYQAPFITLAIKIIDFQKISKYTKAYSWNAIMSEYVYGVNKIMQENGATKVIFQKQYIYCHFSTSLKSDVDKVFKVACILNTFIKHLNLNTQNKMGQVLKNDVYAYDNNVLIKVGIGFSFSEENYIFKIDQEKIIFTGHSINESIYLSSIANTNRYSQILTTESVINNLTDKFKPELLNFKTFKKVNNFDKQVILYGFNLMDKDYDNYISGK